jgi:N-acetylneuraminic acid mutarotase
VADGILYAFGGYTASTYTSVVEAYDPVTDSWTTRAPMPQARSHFAYGVANGVIYAAGGIGTNASGCNTAGVCGNVYAYHPAANVWTTRTSLATVRYTPAGGGIGSLFYAAGGLTSPGSGTYSLSTVEAYHP